MNQIFNPNNLFFRSLSRMVDLVGLSLLATVFSLPVITLVPVFSALYFAMYQILRQKADNGFTQFFRSLRMNWRQSLPLGLIWAAVGLLLFTGEQTAVILANQQGGGMVVFAVAYRVALVLPCGLCCWTAALLARFVMPAGQLWTTAVQLTVKHLPTTVVMALVMAAAAWLCLNFFPLVLLVPAAALGLLTPLCERVFARYLPEEAEPDEEEEEY